MLPALAVAVAPIVRRGDVPGRRVTTWAAAVVLAHRNTTARDIRRTARTTSMAIPGWCEVLGRSATSGGGDHAVLGQHSATTGDGSGRAGSPATTMLHVSARRSVANSKDVRAAVRFSVDVTLPSAGGMPGGVVDARVGNRSMGPLLRGGVTLGDRQRRHVRLRAGCRTIRTRQAAAGAAALWRRSPASGR
jgi:hypothetical protein